MIEHSTARVANFNAGPAVMPLVVLERMQAEMLDYHGRELSVRWLSILLLLRNSMHEH